jgi:Butirosin biosynthesis protein H, N-terminal/Domain of unknown function (DUF4872)
VERFLVSGKLRSVGDRLFPDEKGSTMTVRKHFKQLVRTRMQKTGESYATARRQVLNQSVPGKPAHNVPCHLPGSVGATTALRVLLTHAGVRAPHTGKPFSEALLFGIAGGIGIGVFSFFYEKDDFASFFLAGRHLWHDHHAYLRQTCTRFAIEPVVRETAGAKAGEAALRAILAENGTCIAWVDAANLPHRAMPASMSGGGYHIVTVYAIDDAAGTALIGDLTDEPVSISLADLAVARSRIKKDKHRLLSIPAAASPTDLHDLVRTGLRACHAGLGGAGGVKSAATNFSLEALRIWADRLHGSNDRERWERVFARGPRLWQALVSVHEWIEHQGGGLCRPLFAESLTEAAQACGVAAWRSLAERYAELGHAWSELADAALPPTVPAFREARELHARRAELINSDDSRDDLHAVGARIDELRQQAQDFPLSETECADLRAGLQKRVRALYEQEVAARDALGKAIA